MYSFYKSFLSPKNVLSLANSTKLIQKFSSKSKSYYDVLRVSPKASQKEIKAAYFKLCKLYHPDVNKNSKDAAKRFQEVTEAYGYLRKQSETGKFDSLDDYEDIRKMMQEAFRRRQGIRREFRDHKMTNEVAFVFTFWAVAVILILLFSY